ncbi:curli production assembly/transport component CsgG [Chryseobacterium bernardetii]|uniref:Curli production assembly/transport component CsgG n=2 Tax=Chryseobacterium TaxID=59732 RepID=A0A543EAB1_9FLAO|nr:MULTISPECIES: CsgG/HfaB family protein [Chryseobacterium]MDR6371979.1 curli production assembly/transport component CsgG [Chryseobacterium vietnamense]MDR6443761.1 curli production assembly/transport component CsgG [Chryseobacterium bernardetii]MDR6488356.1 curli production assembly/transport component CsgG [Chryseobacterium vietnamense]TQM18466.1 curli production assembly/transport component CsgG [Chryseobacterium aquifrigidense]
MTTYTYTRIFFCTFLLCILQACSSIFGLPSDPEKPTMGEVTSSTAELKNLPLPKEKIVIGVYKFRDQTGQYKPSENGNNWSTAVPQGTTTILIKALEDSRWFVPIERENIANLLNERQIIRSTRQEYIKDADKNNQALPPLLYAGILLEGGVISYDSNILTGGLGARYFGIGASTQYRQDRITIYLRAVSTLNGEILKTVYTSKTILSTSVNGSFFRYIDTERLLEAEVGLTQNEPVQLAVTEAIEKAVKALIVEGIRDKIWGKAIDENGGYQSLINEYNREQEQNNDRVIGGRYPQDYRQKLSVFANVEGQKVKDDYVGSKMNVGGKIGLKYFLTPYLNVELNASYFTLENSNIVKRNYYGPEVNLEYILFPKYRFSPFVYGGAGALYSKYKPQYKAQFGGGLEYMISKNFSLRASAQYDLGFKDDWEGLVNGKRKDQALRFGIGINFYFGNK